MKILPDSECKRTKETNNDMAVFNYEVIDGKYKGGKILYDNVVWDNNDIEFSTKRFNTILTALGVPDGTPIDSIQQLVTAAKGKTLNITVDWKHSDYNDRWNLSVKAYNKLDEEGSKPNGVERPISNEANKNTFAQQHSNDPFAGSSTIDISDDDLPF